MILLCGCSYASSLTHLVDGGMCRWWWSSGHTKEKRSFRMEWHGIYIQSKESPFQEPPAAAAAAAIMVQSITKDSTTAGGRLPLKTAAISHVEGGTTAMGSTLS